jgi:hypothetical protein
MHWHSHRHAPRTHHYTHSRRRQHACWERLHRHLLRGVAIAGRLPPAAAAPLRLLLLLLLHGLHGLHRLHLLHCLHLLRAWPCPLGAVQGFSRIPS